VGPRCAGTTITVTGGNATFTLGAGRAIVIAITDELPK